MGSLIALLTAFGILRVPGFRVFLTVEFRALVRHTRVTGTSSGLQEPSASVLKNPEPQDPNPKPEQK